MKGVPEAIAYCRVAEHEPREHLQIQGKAIERFAEREGIAEICWFEEVGKGSDDIDHRPHLAEALGLARKLKIPLLVTKVDRLSRSFHFITGLMEDRHLKFVVTDEVGASDTFALHVLAALVEKNCGDD